MTARDVTGILRFFLRPEIGQFSPHFEVISLLNYTENLEKKEKNPLEKTQKIQWRNFPKLQISVPCRVRTCPDLRRPLGDPSETLLGSGASVAGYAGSGLPQGLFLGNKSIST